MTSELDEIEKEEFFRLKKVLKVKIRNEELAKLEEAGASGDHDDEDDNNNLLPPGPPAPTPTLKAATATTTTPSTAPSLPVPKVAAGSFADVVSDFVTASAASPASAPHTAAAASRASLPLSPFDDVAGVTKVTAAAVATTGVVGTGADEPPSTTDPFSSF